MKPRKCDCPVCEGREYPTPCEFHRDWRATVSVVCCITAMALALFAAGLVAFLLMIDYYQPPGMP